MRKVILCFCMGILLLSFSKIEFQPKSTTADVQKLNGMAVFIESEPVLDYESLGEIKYEGTFGVSGQYQEVRDALIRKARKKHKDADGIIIRFCNGCTDRADVIKFK